MPVLCKEQGNKLRMHGLVASEVSAEEAADEVAVNRGVIAGKMYIFD
jgi:hypothetical protein